MQVLGEVAQVLVLSAPAAQSFWDIMWLRQGQNMLAAHLRHTLAHYMHE